MEQLDDFLEQSPYVQKKKEEGREIGLEEGLAQGLQKALLTIVQRQFPPLTELAHNRVMQVTKPDALDLLLTQILNAPDEATARSILNTLAA